MLAKLAAVLVIGLAASSEATVLTFDGIAGGGGFGYVPADYGDRVVATSQGGYGYGAGSGYTPNVVVDYAPNSGTFAVYASGYGNLVNALGHAQFNVPGEIRLVPDAGYRVRLNSFRIASWSASSYTTDLRIWDDAGSFASPNLFSGSVLVSSGGSLNPLPAPVVGQGTVRIYSNIWGNIGLDDVDFNQVTVPGVPIFPYPEP
jgi:uncharacterized protein YfaP (DUF2135 family)